MKRNSFNWFEPQEIKEPFEGAVAIATLPVKVIYKHVTDLVIDIEEDETEIKYTGWVMDTLPDRFLAKDYEHDKIIGQMDMNNKRNKWRL